MVKNNLNLSQIFLMRRSSTGLLDLHGCAHTCAITLEISRYRHYFQGPEWIVRYTMSSLATTHEYMFWMHIFVVRTRDNHTYQKALATCLVIVPYPHRPRNATWNARVKCCEMQSNLLTSLSWRQLGIMSDFPGGRLEMINRRLISCE